MMDITTVFTAMIFVLGRLHPVYFSARRVKLPQSFIVRGKGRKQLTNRHKYLCSFLNAYHINEAPGKSVVALC